MSAQAGRFTVRSDLYKVDLEITMYPPMRIVISRLNYKKGAWELAVDESKSELKYEGADKGALLSGQIIVKGPILFQCNSSNGSMLMKDMTITGIKANNRPHESGVMQLANGTLVYPLPLYILVSGEKNTPISEVRLGNIVDTTVLPLFTSESIAKAGGLIPVDFRLEMLGKNQLVKIMELARKSGFTHIVLDPIMGKRNTTLDAKPIEDFINDLSGSEDDKIISILNSTDMS